MAISNACCQSAGAQHLPPCGAAPVLSCTTPRELISLDCYLPSHDAFDDHEIGLGVEGMGDSPRLSTAAMMITAVRSRFPLGPA